MLYYPESIQLGLRPAFVASQYFNVHGSFVYFISGGVPPIRLNLLFPADGNVRRASARILIMGRAYFKQ